MVSTYKNPELLQLFWKAHLKVVALIQSSRAAKHMKRLDNRLDTWREITGGQERAWQGSAYLSYCCTVRVSHGRER